MINETETPPPKSVPEMQTKEIKEEKEERMPFDNSVEESMIQTSIPSSSSYSPPAVKEEEEKKPAKKEEEKKKTSRFSRLFGRKNKDKGEDNREE